MRLSGRREGPPATPEALHIATASARLLETSGSGVPGGGGDGGGGFAAAASSPPAKPASSTEALSSAALALPRTGVRRDATSRRFPRSPRRPSAGAGGLAQRSADSSTVGIAATEAEPPRARGTTGAARFTAAEGLAEPAARGAPAAAGRRRCAFP